MLNFIRADLWRLCRSRLLYLVLALLLLIMTNLGLVLYRAATMDYDSYLETQSREAGVTVTIADAKDGEQAYTEMQQDLINAMDSGFFLGFLTGEPGLLYLGFGLFMTSFITADFRQGYFKNILNIPAAKTKWLVSKLIVSLVVATFFLATIILGASLLSYWRVGQLGYTVETILPFALAHILGLTSLGATISLLATVFQHTMATMLITVALALNVQASLLGLIGRLNLTTLKLSDQNLLSRLFVLEPSSQTNLTPIIVFAAIYLLGAWLISRIILEKRDIA